MRIGFLGLGTMGAPLANNLRKAGFSMTVWNRTAARARPLVDKGATQAMTARACAEGKDLVFTCLSDEGALEAVLSGPDGVLAGLGQGDLLVDTSTAGARAARAVRQRVEARGASFVAAPLLGSKPAAEQAQLVVVAGGTAAARERARPALHAISARLFELDDPAQAALMKLVVNAIGGAMVTALGEALALGASGGLALPQMIDVVQASGFHSPIYLMKGEQLARRDLAPRFQLSLAEKDQRLAQEAAAEQGAKVPLNEAVRGLMRQAIEAGHGGDDMCAVAELFFAWANVKR